MAHPRAFARLIAAHGVPVYFNFFARVGDGSPAAGAFHSAQGDFFMGLPKLPASWDTRHTTHRSAAR